MESYGFLEKTFHIMPTLQEITNLQSAFRIHVINEAHSKSKSVLFAAFSSVCGYLSAFPSEPFAYLYQLQSYLKKALLSRGKKYLVTSSAFS